MTTSNKNFKVKNGLDVNGEITVSAVGGDEGGQINLEKPATGTTLAGNVAVDVYQNKIRFFEQGGSARGAYIDLTAASAGAGSNLLAGGGGGITSVVEDSTPQLGGDLDAQSYDITSVNAITLDTTPTGVPATPGTISWDADNETVQITLDGANLQVGQEHIIRVKNNSGSVAIPDRTVVMFAGATGDTVKVSPADSSNIATYPSDYLVGITTEEIPADGFGFVTQFGFINNVNTNSWTVGSLLYADPLTPGGLTSTKPSAPAWQTPVAAVTKQNASAGRILVRAIPGISISAVEGVLIGSSADNEILSYDSASNLWKNQNASQAGLAESGHVHDDRYYTESETDTLLNTKANTSHSHAISDVTGLSSALSDKLNSSDAPEVARDAIASALTPGTGIVITPNDAADTITVSVNTSDIQEKVANVSNTEIGYLDGVTSSIQNQLDDKAPIDAPHLTGDAQAENLTITGNLTVQGTTTTVSATNLEISDPLIYIATGNTGAANDIGIVGHFDNGTYQHTGLVRDATDNKWKLFSGVTTEPSTEIAFGSATYDTLVAGTVEADLTGTATKATAAGYYVSGTGTNYATPTDTTRIFVGQGQPATAPTGGFKTGDIWIGW